MMRNILLVQPRHIYAPEPSVETVGHIYMPTSLLTIASILISNGHQVTFVDENLERCNLENNLVGINLVGAPYIPVSLRYQERLRIKHSNNYQLVIGGQIVNGLSDDQIKRIFGNNVINGNRPERLSHTLGIRGPLFHSAEQTSLIPAYSLIPDSHLKCYLQNEFSFYLSTGCKYSCSFCAAQRSIYDRLSKIIRPEKESYRDINLAVKDFEFLVSKAVSFGVLKLRIYLSNLDLFQTPSALGAFANKVNNIKSRYKSVDLYIRGLSTVKSFLNTHENFPDVLITVRKAGLKQIGFGIDGSTPEIWKKTRKPQNSESDCIRAIQIAKEMYDFIPETLMVFGHNEIDDENSLKLTLQFAEDMMSEFGAIPRPHVAKDVVPGNDGWRNPKNRRIIEELSKNPILFQNLDFTALPSPVTHPKKEFRELVKKYYLKVCELPGSLTQYVLPELPTLSEKDMLDVRNFNQKKYDI